VLLLAIDTSTSAITVAVHDGTSVLAESSTVDARRHGEHLAPGIVRVLSQAGRSASDVTAVVAGLGPGPFTGLRVGLVTARTLGFVLGIPVHGVCSLDVLAVEAVDTAAVTGHFVVATDARRKEVYLASYDAEAARLHGPLVEHPGAAATDLPVVGEGATLYPDAFPNAAGPARPSAGWLARVVTGQRAELRDPEPLYLRRPDAVAPGRPKPVS
jgi:tRNA threonylcarbamoyl adenosine modification protein YeaZ